jgi:hypothetical protein
MKKKIFDVKTFVRSLVELGTDSTSKDISEFLAKKGISVNPKSIEAIIADYNASINSI